MLILCIASWYIVYMAKCEYYFKANHGKLQRVARDTHGQAGAMQKIVAVILEGNYVVQYVYCADPSDYSLDDEVLYSKYGLPAYDKYLLSSKVVLIATTVVVALITLFVTAYAYVSIGYPSCERHS